MKIALICPSNLLYMPYVQNYRYLLDKYKVNYEVIYWDRFHTETKKKALVYIDGKKGHSRNILDYLKYTKFIKRRLKSEKYDKVIVFGLQLAFFLQKTLQKYTGNYLIDIRDYNRIAKYFSFKKIIEASRHTVISSKGFEEWLPESEKYIINHNTRNIKIEKVNSFLDKSNKINLSYIGTLRDLKINIKLIESLKNNRNYTLYYHGDGMINNEIKEYLSDNNIDNVRVTGLYKPVEEPELYINSHIINVLIPTTDINSKTLLPNRLYNAVFYGKPVLTVQGTYVADLIKKYQLGIVLNSLESIDNDVQEYFDGFDLDSYNKGRELFLKNVINDNKKFENVIKAFIHGEI